MKMKFFVIGFIFNKSRDRVLLIEKRRPEWQTDHWNGIGGKVDEKDLNPLEAMQRETIEEIGALGIADISNYEHALTFVCPGGTVFVFRAFSSTDKIVFCQIEDEVLAEWPVFMLPLKIMNNLRWIIPVCLSTLQFPLIVQQNTLGVE